MIRTFMESGMEPASLISEEAIRPLIERFYERVRADPLLAPLFQARLTDFWSSIMLGTGRYKGNPVALHLIHADGMTAERFDRWLELWRQTSGEMLPPTAARSVQAKAERIAESLQLAIQYRRPAVA